MVMETVLLSGHIPPVVYCTVYGPPKVLAERSISPVEVFKNTISPDDSENTPPPVPEIVATGSVPVWQNVPEE